MCFSTSSSFGAGAILTVIGVASIKKVKSPAQIPFASIPLIFAVQHITEGFVWLSLSNPSYALSRQAGTDNFLFFAQVVWPVWVPFAMLKLEPKSRRRLASKILVGIGAMVSAYLAYCLLTFPVEAQIVGSHISYEQKYPAAIGRYSGFFYVVATIVPPFLSRIRRMWLLGTTIFISYVITTIFYTDYIVSVWCFFASIISISIFAIMYELNRPKKVVPKLSMEEVSSSPLV